MAVIELIKDMVKKHLNIENRLQNVVSAYLLSLMLEAPKHTQSFAARATGINQSQFSRLLSSHENLAKESLQVLGRKIGRKISKPDRNAITAGAPWTIAILIDASLHPRSSLHVHNCQRFNHGQGFVIGHQWTNIVVRVNDRTIPLPPIPFWSKNECKRRGVDYKTEHERLIDYLGSLNLAAIVGTYEADEVVVLTDSGYDDKKIQNAILSLGWDFAAALKTSRGSASQSNSAGDAKKWCRIDDLFWATRKHAPWKTVRVHVDGGKKRRRFRARKLVGHIKGISCLAALVCSEKSGRTGKRYFACSKPNLDAGVIIRVYAKRWEVELFHRAIKHQFGLLDAGVEDFSTLSAHVHWVYCAYLLLEELDIPDVTTPLQKQRKLAELLQNEPWTDRLQKILAARTQFGGIERQEKLLRVALQETMIA